MFREALVCNSNDEKCMLSQCNSCGNLKMFDKFSKCSDKRSVKDLTSFRWETANSRVTKVKKNLTVQHATDELKAQTTASLLHSFVIHI